MSDIGNCVGLHPFGLCAPGQGCNKPPEADVRKDLHAALAEIMRMREAAERIIWLAESGRNYGKGRGQAAREILDAAIARAPRLPPLDDPDPDYRTYVEGLLVELRERARVSEEAWKR